MGKEKKRTSNKEDPMKGFLLQDLVEVKFKKGSTLLQYKTDFHQESYASVDFLQKKFKRTMQEPEAIPVRGIPKQKKDAIIAVLGQLMSKNRLEFGNSIIENDSAQDLVDSQGTENID
ncbi:unnamed protein product [Psylliodes chrysocephalus]|uniref:Uncharacterized protein n=1 Tax=Psylliodes chrysocephalus TaxID=3402493 RepID=A0A9P0CI16_9CUCU|nr:unnamed protein product [Psylliodes chrysocephala]